MSLDIFASLAALQGGTSALPGMIFMYGAIFAIMYFLLIRPQQKQKRLHEGLVRALKRGDEVVTAGGVVGEVLHIVQQTKDGAAAPAMDDRITIKSGESRLIVERGRIARVVSTTTS
jgi:preprotein translocase subunit YajC